jgi:hypothetical protein
MAAPPVSDIAHTIQLSVAPVFLLTALSSLLSVITSRLSRVVDRTRLLVDRREGLDGLKRERVETELKLLVRRRQLINTAITSATLAALLVCLTIAVVFLGSLFEVNTGFAIAVLFVLAMAATVAVLTSFLREVRLASAETHVEFQ